jgi:hypothetical protein
VSIERKIISTKLEAMFDLLKDTLENGKPEEVGAVADECLALLDFAAEQFEINMGYVLENFPATDFNIAFDDTPLDPFSLLDLSDLNHGGNYALEALRRAHDVANLSKWTLYSQLA